ncbi:MAG: hypothetical protein DRR42_05445 [Gammaproteobacteria bacterium]|nr:MAG: hypothetical protein DRR42_05445 [Gammaproteobacteria bacterium]
MSGESSYAKTVVMQALDEAKSRSDMDIDAMGRAIIQVVVTQYLVDRSAQDVRQELEYLAESLDDDEPVVTRGC